MHALFDSTANSKCFLMSHLQVLRALDLYCGCGGLSFTGSNEFQTTGARVEVAYAVDAWPDATATFKLNHPQTKVT